MTAPDKGTPLVELLRKEANNQAVEWNMDPEVHLMTAAADRIEALERDALRLAGELAGSRKLASDYNDMISDLKAQLAQVTAERNLVRDALRHAIDAKLNMESALASREGWQLVPNEPTPEMLEPFARQWCVVQDINPDEQVSEDWPAWYPMCDGLDACYRAMLAAAVKEKPSE